MHTLEEKSSHITEKARNENLPLQPIQLRRAEALFSKATGLIGKTAELGYWLRISDERVILQ